MNWAALPRAAVALLIFLLFVVAPSVSYLLGGPDELDAGRVVAAAAHDVEREFATPAKDMP